MALQQQLPGAKLKSFAEKGMPFGVSVEELFSKMCNHIEKRIRQKAVLSDIIIQGPIVRAISCEKIRIEGVRCSDIYFVFEFLNREKQFNWSIMESSDVFAIRNGMIFALWMRNSPLITVLKK